VKSPSRLATGGKMTADALAFKPPHGYLPVVYDFIKKKNGIVNLPPLSYEPLPNGITLRKGYWFKVNTDEMIPRFFAGDLVLTGEHSRPLECEFGLSKQRTKTTLSFAQCIMITI
jgi:hypothetical protein